jgi:hypothetical protein
MDAEVLLAPGLALLVGIVGLILPLHGSRAQEEGAAEHRAVLEAGMALAWDLGERTRQTGGTLAIEVTPIENWLELELGLSAVTAAWRRTRYTRYQCQLTRRPRTVAGPRSRL